MGAEVDGAGRGGNRAAPNSVDSEVIGIRETANIYPIVEPRGARGFKAPKFPIGEPIVAFAVHPCPLASSVQSITVRAVTSDHAEGLQYHVLPTDDPLRALNILREAAGLQPLSDEHVRADFERGEPRCRICRDETVRVDVNELLDLRGVPIILGRGRIHRITLTEILRDLEPFNEGRDTRRRITYDSLWVHAKRQYDLAGITAYWRIRTQKEFKEFKKALRR